MTVKWSAIAIDAILILFVIGGLVALHHFHTHPSTPLVQVIPAPAPVTAPAPAPVVVPAPVHEPAPVAKHETKRAPVHAKLDCAKVKQAVSGHSKEEIETYGRGYGLSASDIKAVQTCM